MAIKATQVWPAEFARRYRAAGYWQGQTLGQFLHQAVSTFPDNHVVIDGDEHFTYRLLDQQATAIAQAIVADGRLQVGDRAIVQFSNCYFYLPLIFGLFRAGIIPVFALPAHREAEIRHFLHNAEARAYFGMSRHGDFDYAELLTTLQSDFPDLKMVSFYDPEKPDSGLQKLLVQGLKLVTQQPHALPDIKADSVAFMQISGGSTGLPKLIPRTHDDYLYSVRESAKICGLHANSVMLQVLPISHNYSMSSPGVLGIIFAGGSVIMLDNPRPEAALALIATHKVSILCLVPPLLLAWLEYIQNQHAQQQSVPDISSLQNVLVGGAKLLAEVAKRVKPVLGAQLQQVFGMAEGLVNYTRLNDTDELVLHTQGCPISPADEILVTDDHGNPVPCGTVGNLLTRGPYTIRAYHNNPSANARSFTVDGFYRTGDLVVQDEHGYLEVKGRSNDQINRAGEKISAEEIEEYLLSNPKVFDAAVIALPDEYLSERTCAVIIPRGTPPTSLEIKRWVREQHVAAFKVPDQVVFVSDFAFTAVGKTSRKQLRAEIRAHLLDKA